MNLFLEGYNLAIIKYKSIDSDINITSQNNLIDNSTIEKYNTSVNNIYSSNIKETISSNKIDDIISMASKKYDIPESIIYKVIQAESGFNINAKSSCGALGLMQIMPANLKANGVKNPYDPYQNIMTGVSMLKNYTTRFGSLKLGLAAYNAGPGNVKKYNGVPPFKETQKYIKKILGE